MGNRNAAPILIRGLKRLEYRGYDSAGMCLKTKDDMVIMKTSGRITNLETLSNEFTEISNMGLSHTRWATHGPATKINAHPHTDCNNRFAIVHNGIIENYSTLKRYLESKGHKFISDTDTEIIAHLLEEEYTGNLLDTAIKVLSILEGAYGLVIMQKDQDELIGARNGSPLVLGVGAKEFFLSSDASSIAEHTKKIVYLGEGEIVKINKKGYKIFDHDKKYLQKEPSEVNMTIDQLEKDGYETYMLKEIFKQPESIADTFRGRILKGDNPVKLGGPSLSPDEIKKIKRIIITACGTSWHAALVAKQFFEENCRIPVVVDYASEFRYNYPLFQKEDLFIAISQSGETADTLAAVRLAKKNDITTLGIVNVVGSTIARECKKGIYLHAGPEIGVASTKAFTSQITALFMLSLMMGLKRKTISKTDTEQLIEELHRIPVLVTEILEKNNKIKKIANQYYNKPNFLYLGRGINFPVALEGALKLKEISYIHAEGYPAAEMKHGPIALIDEQMPVVFVVQSDGQIYNKILSNMEEVKSRGGKIIAVTDKVDRDIKKLSDSIIKIPKVDEQLSPLLNVIPLQLLAYHIATLRNLDVDKPRNLAKSVTVE